MANDNYDFELVLALLKKKSYEELWSYALAHANSGDSYAQCVIAFLYQFGLGVPTAGMGRAFTASDGWTVRTYDQARSAHFEHTIVVTEDEPILLTA